MHNVIDYSWIGKKIICILHEDKYEFALHMDGQE